MFLRLDRRGSNRNGPSTQSLRTNRISPSSDTYRSEKISSSRSQRKCPSRACSSGHALTGNRLNSRESSSSTVKNTTKLFPSQKNVQFQQFHYSLIFDRNRRKIEKNRISTRSLSFSCTRLSRYEEKSFQSNLGWK